MSSTEPEAAKDGKKESSNPFALLSNLDPSKKYTLVFLASIGTTLLVTGASGGRLLKRAKKATATPSPSPSAPFHPHPIPPAPVVPPPTLLPKAGRSKPLLKSWRHLSASPNSAASASYFLPNATLLAESTLLADEIDKEDRLHKDGVGPEGEPDAVDDGFNPALFAGKAFAIATGITVTAFAVAIGGLMAYLGVKDLESLSLALSHSLPTAFSSRRPSLPSWAQPATKEPSTPGAEEANDEHREGVAYWVHVKETLDREAEELKRERRRAWERIQGKVGTGTSEGVEGPPGTG